MLDADGRHADDELWALITAFATRLDSQLGGATPATVRDAGLVSGRAIWLDQPSALFATLLAYDRRHATRYARTYVHRAFRLGLAAAAIDFITSESELQAVERILGDSSSVNGGVGPAPSAPNRSIRAGAGSAPARPARPVATVRPSQPDDRGGRLGHRSSPRRSGRSRRCSPSWTSSPGSPTSRPRSSW